MRVTKVIRDESGISDVSDSFKMSQMSQKDKKKNYKYDQKSKIFNTKGLKGFRFLVACM